MSHYFNFSLIHTHTALVPRLTLALDRRFLDVSFYFVNENDWLKISQLKYVIAAILFDVFFSFSSFEISNGGHNLQFTILSSTIWTLHFNKSNKCRDQCDRLFIICTWRGDLSVPFHWIVVYVVIFFSSFWPKPFASGFSQNQLRSIPHQHRHYGSFAEFINFL